jgi:recombinational DNA repair protein (RecF pathway)
MKYYNCFRCCKPIYDEDYYYIYDDEEICVECYDELNGLGSYKKDK